jgi:hypothetical protein
MKYSLDQLRRSTFPLSRLLRKRLSASSTPRDGAWLVAPLGRHDIPDIYRYVGEYLDLPEELKPYWPAVAHWHAYVDHMSEGRRQRYIEQELIPEFRSFLHVSRMPWCTEIQQTLIAGSDFVPLDYVHIVRCEHCKWLVPRWYRHLAGLAPSVSRFV